jgi:hypothetical protein
MFYLTKLFLKLKLAYVEKRTIYRHIFKICRSNQQMEILREYLQYLSLLGWEAIASEGKLRALHPVMLSVGIPL